MYSEDEMSNNLSSFNHCEVIKSLLHMRTHFYLCEDPHLTYTPKTSSLPQKYKTNRSTSPNINLHPTNLLRQLVLPLI